MTRLRRSRTATEPILHRAARVEDAFHRWRKKLGRRRGLKTTIIPYVGYGGSGWTRVLCRVVLTRGEQRAERVRGWRSFFSIPVDDRDVTITAGEVQHRVRADRGGVVDVRIDTSFASGWHAVELRTDDSQPVSTPVLIVDPNSRFGLLSDVDDTVMVTALPRPFLAAWNTFVLDENARAAVAGMAVLYERIMRANPGAPIIYLSTGAWNVAPTLRRFMDRNLYPQGPLLLTDWGPTHDRWFRSGKEHKRVALERLATEFPGLKWLLVGDDGQHDEQLYGEFAIAHPENVAAVAIRQLSAGQAVLAGGRTKAAAHEAGSSVRWFYAPDGAGLSEQLMRAGLLP